MGRGNVQAGRNTERQAFHGPNKGLSPSNDPDLAKKREKKMKKGSWTELRKSVTSWTNWASWGTGQDVTWTSSLKLDQLDHLVDLAQPAGPTVGQSDHRILKIDPNMVYLREKTKQTATGTTERTSKNDRVSWSKDRIMDHGLEPVRSCDLMLKCWDKVVWEGLGLAVKTRGRGWMGGWID
ncbi:hypothetical protein F2Q69_00028775 [Brassica cretica]|uniref:Uncharacterized protein n=1 Tax=Brassica cretica TaxID=69181 RepID=A0A8S9S8T1_BRACR|nr:hypothetical protein F2Q69_00028775 [Brassica cretica]